MGVYDLGLTDVQFWSLTPAQFTALRKRHDVRRDLADRRSAQICQVLCMTTPGNKKKWKLKDFMPQYGKEEPTKKTPNQMLQFWRECVVPRFSKRDKN